MCMINWLKKLIPLILLNLKTDYKITEIEGKIPSIAGLANATLHAVENNIPSVSNLVKKKRL